MLTLTILHNIYLSKEQRYSLATGNTIEIIGISVPVWFYQGSTSEPAREIYCKYTLENNKDKKSGVFFNKDGYKINIPQFPKNYKIPKLKDKLMAMNKYEEWYKNNIPVSGKDMLDLEDGGIKYMEFREYGKFIYGVDVIGLMHTIEIKPVESLIKTLS